MTEFARNAADFGGTVSAKHGLGKRKRHLLAIQYTPAEIDKMKSVKTSAGPGLGAGLPHTFRTTLKQKRPMDLGT
jgi:hypothetical protein